MYCLIFSFVIRSNIFISDCFLFLEKVCARCNLSVFLCQIEFFNRRLRFVLCPRRIFGFFDIFLLSARNSGLSCCGKWLWSIFGIDGVALYCGRQISTMPEYAELWWCWTMACKLIAAGICVSAIRGDLWLLKNHSTEPITCPEW